MGIFGVSLLIIALLVSKTGQKKAVTAALVITLVGLSLYISWWLPPQPKYQAWYDVQIWFSKNTPEDSLVLVPPYRRGFRSFSGRGVYATWPDADFLSYMPFLGVETNRRLKTLGYDFKKAFEILPVRGWGLPIDVLRSFYQDKARGLTDKRLNYMVKKEGIDYMVTEKNQTRDLPLVYQNDFYQVFQVHLKMKMFKISKS